MDRVCRGNAVLNKVRNVSRQGLACAYSDRRTLVGAVPGQLGFHGERERKEAQTQSD